MNKPIVLAGVLGLGLAVMNGCATSPLGRSQLIMMPDSDMAQLGGQTFLSLQQQTPTLKDPKANAYVECVADALTREVGGQWEVAVFQDSSANAFALPGGKIGVNAGMLKVAANQDQLATVIAHEVAHVLARHSNERVSQEMAVKQGINLVQSAAAPSSAGGQALMGLLGVGAEYGVLKPFSRVQESEADLMGLDLMAKAGFDPKASVDLWTNMGRATGGAQPPEFMSTHPAHATRIQDLQQRMPSALALSQQARASGKSPHCGQSAGR
ncbi:MAG: M48 family metallopeptidase [Candidatus Methylumidiphilus sp.]